MTKAVSALLFYVGLVGTVLVRPIRASDPDLTTDLGIENPSVANFTFTEFRNITPNGQGVATRHPAAFNSGLPGLTGLGLSVVLVEFGPMSQINPHFHPRATEVFYLTSGKVEVGFVDTSNTLFQTTLETGDVFVFPKGTVHFVINKSQDTATGYGVLSSENPGSFSVATGLFTASGTGLPNDLLVTALRTDVDTVETIKTNLLANK